MLKSDKIKYSLVGMRCIYYVLVSYVSLFRDAVAIDFIYKKI